MADHESIIELMEYVLETINGIFEHNGVALPERQFFAMGGVGETPHDCEQVTISLEQLYTGLPGAQEQLPQKCSGPRTAVLVVEIVRCIPTPKQTRGGQVTLPDIDSQTAIAKTQATDAWLLMESGLVAGENMTLFGALADVSAGSISGGYQAMIMNLIIGVP